MDRQPLASRFPAWLVFSLLALCSTAWAAESEVVDASPEERLGALVEAFDSQDSDRHLDFFTKHCSPSERPIEARIATFGRITLLTGGLEDVRLVEASTSGVIALARQRRDQRWVRVTLDLDAEAPHAIASFGLELTSPPIETGGEPLDEEALVRELDRLVEGLVAEEKFSGALRLARGEKILYERAAGLAERRFAVPNRIDTKFNLGSINKVFTAVAIARLVDQGRLRFEDRLVDHLPDLPRAERFAAITLEHLLSHRAGLGSYWEELMAVNFGEVRDHRQLVELAIGKDPDFEAGSQFRYSNLGYVLLGRVIEEVTGESYFDHVRRVIFEPLGMEGTDSWASDDPVPNLATGYTRHGLLDDGGHHDEPAGPWRSNIFQHSAKGCAAGGGYSTVGDLHRFARGLWHGALLRPETRKRLFSPLARGYGLGFGIRGRGALRSIGHNGGAPGISADWRHYPESDMTLAVLSNIDGGARALGNEIEALLARLEASS